MAVSGLTKVVVGLASVCLVAAALIGWRAYEGNAALPHPSCGSASTHGLSATTEMLSADRGALACFHAAAKNCKAASLKVTQMGVDAGTDNVFAIKPGSRPCEVTEFSQFYIVTGDVHRNSVTSTTCHVAAATARGVTLSCGRQQLLVPVTVSLHGAGG